MTKNNYYRGIRGVYMIWHGEWADPELRYKKYVANYWEVEDTMWDAFKDEFDIDTMNEETKDIEFNRYCKDNAYRIKELIIEYSHLIIEI